MRSATRFIPVLLVLSLIGAAGSPEQRATPAWLLHVPGMGGKMVIDRLLTSGLLEGGIEAKLEIFDWTGEDRGPIALVQVARHETQSTLLAKKIEAYVRDNPNQQVIITCHSAGAGIVVWALEKLPDDVMIDDLVMISSALSPQYDLSKALRHVRHRAYAFNSSLDTLILSVGTKMLGTVDRVKGDAAGLNGYVMPETADKSQYAKLEQIPYDADWMRFDNNGEHIGPMMRPFAKNVIARVVLGKGLPPRATTAPATRPTATPTTVGQ
jgi:pimeloyl-ACP methyl ester carboxylesterase